jgi:predicted dehydrogenase
MATRLGIVGAGLIWIREHQRALAQSDVFVPAAFCDLSAERRTALASDYPQALITDDLAQLLAYDAVDAVLVLTPIAYNAPTALAALEAGKHVIMEKPIARSAEEGRQLVDRAAALGKRLCVAEHMAYRPSNAVIKALLTSGTLGQLVYWECIRHYAGDPDSQQGAMRYDATAWRQQPDYPLGAMFDGGIHAVSMLSTLFGQPVAVDANGRKIRQGYGEFDHVLAFSQYADGMSGLLSFSQWMPACQRFTIHGTSGIADVTSNAMRVSITGQDERVVALPAEDGRMAMWSAFERCFAHDEAPAYSPEHALANVVFLAAAERAIKTQTRVLL